eukprot:3051832-Prymnesium_polylepis.1
MQRSVGLPRSRARYGRPQPAGVGSKLALKLAGVLALAFWVILTLLSVNLGDEPSTPLSACQD